MSPPCWLTWRRCGTAATPDLPPFITVRHRFWRMLAPKWAHRPLSGDGAATRGGRHNEPGMPALYMSEAFTTAIAEYEQDLGIRPGTLCAYDVDVAPVIDLCNAAWIGPDVLRCPWKKIAFVDKARPPTWDIARRLFDAGAAGVRVPSVQVKKDGVNLVLWRWNDVPDRTVRALDPLADLPRDQRSWGL
jgi:RES domain-containing protein